MTEIQPAVDAIRESDKAEKGIRYTLKTPKQERMRIEELTFTEIEQGATLRYLLRQGYTVIERELINIKVGTTPESEERTGGYSE